MRKILSLVTMSFLVLNMVPSQCVSAQEEIKVKYNNKQLQLDAQPYVKGGRTLVPFRKVLEAFGVEVSWNGEEQTITAKKTTTEIYLKIGVNYAYVNGSKVNLDVSPEITGGRTFVPLRFISENLGAEVKWDGTNKIVSIENSSNTYKLNQEGAYKDVKFSINKIDSSSESGVLKIIGKINFDAKDMVLEVADDYGYVLPAKIVTTGKSGDMINFEGEALLPGCHNFIGKYIVIKQLNSEQKLVKIAEYQL